MQNIVYVKNFEPPKINYAEIRRYAGIRGEYKEGDELIDSCLGEVLDKLIYKVCYCRLPISFGADFVDLSFMKTKSESLRKNLKDCDEIILFAVTVGIEIDRLITRYSSISPSRSLTFQAIGAERIESLCDAFNLEIKNLAKSEGKSTSMRTSPGYGDFSLDAQKEIFAILDCPRKIGLTLNSGLIMSPSKSVTAIIGIGKRDLICSIDNPCHLCNKKNCEFGRRI